VEEGGGKDDEEEADCEDLWACGVVSVGGLGAKEGVEWGVRRRGR